MKFIGRTFGAGAMAFLMYVAFLTLQFFLILLIFCIAYFGSNGKLSGPTTPAGVVVLNNIVFVLPALPAFFTGATIRKMARWSHPIAVMLGSGAGCSAVIGICIAIGAPLGIEIAIVYQAIGSILGLAGYGLMSLFTRRKKKIEEEDLE